MDHYECIYILEDTKLLRKKVSEVNEMLKNANIFQLDLSESEDGQVVLGVLFGKKKRNGAKPGVKMKRLDISRPATVGEIRLLMKKHGPDYVAKQMGVGKATLYRRLRGKEDGEYIS